MAKFYGNNVKTGKVGGSVFSVRFGETIERQYQPVVFNPSTQAQVENRAKLKLLSQFGAVVGPFIPLRRRGAVSPRNLFTKFNYGNTTYSNNQAEINLASVTLTNGVVALPAISAVRSGNTVTTRLNSADRDVSRVVYLLFRKEISGDVRILNSAVISVPGDGNNFLTEIAGSSGNLFVLAYGVRDNTEAARVIFGNLNAPTAQEIARVLVSRVLLDTDVTLTTTQYAAVTDQA